MGWWDAKGGEGGDGGTIEGWEERGKGEGGEDEEEGKVWGGRSWGRGVGKSTISEEEGSILCHLNLYLGINI